MQIKYDPHLWKILSNVTKISNMIAITPKGDKNIIGHKNNNIAYFIKTSKKMLDCGEHELYFRDFKEFNSILTTVDDCPNISVDDKNVFEITSKDNTTCIRYAMGNAKLITKLENEPSLTEFEGQFQLKADTLARVKELAKLIGLTNELNKPKVDVTISAESKTIKFDFNDKNPGNSNSFDYVFENISPKVITKDIKESLNINSILDLPPADYEILISTDKIKLMQMKALNLNEDISINFFCGFFKQ